MDVLLIEASAFSPSLGTAGEIAINAAVAGNKTGFSFIYVDNPEDPRWISNRQSQRFGKRSWKQKVWKVESILRNYGVTTLPEEFLSEKARLTIQDYVQNAPHSLRELKAYKYNDADLGLGTVSSLITLTQSTEPDPDQHYPLIKGLLRCAAIVYEKSRALILKYNPQKIIGWNGRSASVKGIFEAAKQLGVEVQYSERGATYNEYELFDQPPHDFAYLR
ncbi:MAG: hypothetical protein F6K56_34520, partial [Moorea sp. SIO3G5]|nr:hypothetical protein [Moorena sp. SIO3G5]